MSDSLMISSEMINQHLQQAGLLEYMKAPLTTEQSTQLIHFLKLRATWSKTHNLSGPRALALLSTDIVDAVAVYLCLNSHRPLIDIGSGSGVPGLMVACLAPQQEIYLVEPIAKRCAFMKTALYKLGLSSVKVHRGRWPEEAHAIQASSEALMISRAVVSPEDWPILADQSQPAGIMQMLAHHRPQWTLEGYQMIQELAYADPEGGKRLIRRWEKV